MNKNIEWFFWANVVIHFLDCKENMKKLKEDYMLEAILKYACKKVDIYGLKESWGI